MPDESYKTHNFLFESKGIIARYVDDKVPPNAYLTQANLEEIEENGLGSRLGSVIVNAANGQTFGLPGPVHSLSYLGGLNGQAWRYAGVGTNLYRRPAAGTGPYAVIGTGLSGQPWVAVAYECPQSSVPFLFIADANGVLKDNGTGNAQQMGIFQPQYPVQAQAQAPTQIILDNYITLANTYAYTGISGGTKGGYVSTTLTSAVPAAGIQTVSVAAPTQIGLFQLLTIGGETVLVIAVTPTGFTAMFTAAHTSGTAVTSAELSVTVPPSTTATVSKSFAGTPINAWPVTLNQEDYIGMYLFVSDPAQIQKITLKFDCGDGTFNSDYFYKIIGQGPLQTLLDQNTDSSTSAADAVLSESLGLYSAGESGISQLNTGLNQWTAILIQLSDFAGAGRADFSDPVFNWANVNGYQVEIVTNNVVSATLKFSSLLLFGGAGPDSFAGVAYDWLWTYYNSNDGTESNPSMAMTSVNPPLQTNWITPRRQGVLLTLTHPTLDPQTTQARIYRRGGTLGDNWRRLNAGIPISGAVTTFIDTLTDAQIQQSDTVSLINDVPVTSTLPTPVSTTLATLISTTNQVVSVFPVSMANISLRQQVTLADVTATNSERVIVLTLASDHFTAFVQNTHAAGESVSATASYGQPVSVMALAFDQFFFAGDAQNPSFLYASRKANVQAVSSAAYTRVGTADDGITIVADTKGNLFVSTGKTWWAIAPGAQDGSAPTVYPTAADFGCVAKFGACVKGKTIFYQALDGIRGFGGGDSQYLTQIIEFIFQGIGTTPIPIADQTQFSQTRIAFWNNMVFVSYVGVDGNRHRLIVHTEYQRWRNDEVDAQSMFFEAATKTLVYGDSNGFVHVDRQDLPYDEGSTNLSLVHSPIPVTLITPYGDQGSPANQKNYNEYTLDANTAGQDVAVTLLFNDGQSSLALGTVNTTQRAKVNLSLNAGLGVQAYKVALKLTGSSLVGRIMLYQSKIRANALAETRRSLDTYWMKFGTDTSKLNKNTFWETTGTQAITVNVFYDGNSTPEFTFVIPPLGKRYSYRQRLLARKFRLMRMVATCPVDFLAWTDSRIEWKEIRQGAGWDVAMLPL